MSIIKIQSNFWFDISRSVWYCVAQNSNPDIVRNSRFFRRISPRPGVNFSFSICAVCRLMSGYVPALKQTIQCFHCERRIYPSGGQSYPASGQNQDQSMGERNYRKKKRRKRPKFRLTMPREDPDDFEIISMASPTTSNENQFYQPDTPESENCKNFLNH